MHYFIMLLSILNDKKKVKVIHFSVSMIYRSNLSRPLLDQAVLLKCNMHLKLMKYVDLDQHRGYIDLPHVLHISFC